MTIRTAVLASACLLAGSCAANANEAPAGRVSVQAEPAVVTVEGVAPGRYFVDLPTLEYAFDVTAVCAGDALPESLSISVADARVTVSAGELRQAASRRVVLTVPASQTAPLAVDAFCGVAEPEAQGAPAGMPFAAASETGKPKLLQVPDVLSAQVSLICSHGEERSMTYASRPLGVTLACAPPASAAPGEGAASKEP